MGFESGDTPSRSASEKGADLALTNARQLLRSAEVLAREESFGVAMSLAVVAAEEAIKASALASYWKNGASEGDQYKFQEHLKDHGVRHISGELTTMIFDRIINPIIEMQQQFSSAVDVGDSKEEAAINAVEEFFDTFKSQMDSKSSARQDMQEKRRKWRKADSARKRGLYVDYDEGEWESPQDVDSEDYEGFHDLVAELIDRIDHMIDFIKNDFDPDNVPEVPDSLEDDPIEALRRLIEEKHRS